MDDVLPGFRFYPTEEELISFYLHNKLKGTRPDIDRVIPVVDIYDYNPWDLPKVTGELGCPADGEQWFFFIHRQEREARGGRPNRLTTEGYWKATGSPADIYSSDNCTIIGRKRSMVFYVGRAPNGTKTIWKMNEYKAMFQSHDHNSHEASSSSIAANPQLREEVSLCRIYKRSRSSLWAFDRRPPPQGPPQPAVHLHRHGAANDAAATSAFNYQQMINNIPPAETTTESTSSSHISTYNDPDSQSVQINDNTNPGSTAEGEPCWDSEQFHWFDI